MAKKTTARHHAREDDLDRKQRRIRIIISVGMLIILVFSSIAYFFTPDTSTFSSHGHRFAIETDANGNALGYGTRMGDTQYFFSTRPDDTANIAIPSGLIESMTHAQVVIFLFNPNDNETPVYDAFRFELSRVLSAPVAPTVTEPNAVYQFPQYNCSASQPNAPVIMLTQGPSAITVNSTCYVISGSQQDYALIRDRLVYRLLNITES